MASGLELPGQDAVWVKETEGTREDSLDVTDNTKTDMICRPHEISRRAKQWDEMKTKCLSLMKKYNENKLYRLKKDGEPPLEKNRYPKEDWANFKLLSWVLQAKDGTFTLPEISGVKLSDEALWVATKTLTQKIRHSRYPADFDENGNPRAERQPQDPPPIFFVNGMPCLVVWKGNLFLSGRTLAAYAGAWTLTFKNADVKSGAWGYGLVFIHKDLWPILEEIHTRTPITVIRQVHHSKGLLVDKPYCSEKRPISQDHVPICHADVVGLLSQDGMSWQPIWQLGGYDPRFSGNEDASRISKAYFDRKRLNIGYEDIMNDPYQNVKGTWLRKQTEFKKFINVRDTSQLDKHITALVGKSDLFTKIVEKVFARREHLTEADNLRASIQQMISKLKDPDMVDTATKLLADNQSSAEPGTKKRKRRQSIQQQETSEDEDTQLPEVPHPSKNDTKKAKKAKKAKPSQEEDSSEVEVVSPLHFPHPKKNDTKSTKKAQPSQQEDSSEVEAIPRHKRANARSTRKARPSQEEDSSEGEIVLPPILPHRKMAEPEVSKEDTPSQQEDDSEDGDGY